MINGSRILKSFLDSNTFIFLSVIFLCIFARGLWLVFKHKGSGKGGWHLISPIFYILSYSLIIPQFEQYGPCTSTDSRLKRDLSYIHGICLSYQEDQGSNQQCSTDKVREIFKSNQKWMFFLDKCDSLKLFFVCIHFTCSCRLDVNTTSYSRILQ